MKEKRTTARFSNPHKVLFPKVGITKSQMIEECNLNQIGENVLAEYDSKRDFEVTSEPKGTQKREDEGNIFVVQEHHARSLHYDLRIERDGVLKSWAVPKGIPLVPKLKRLAVKTEDHPLEYASFQGTIPKGQYGAGTVETWDKGSYVLKRWSEDTIEFYPKGQRLSGRYVLVRLKKSGEKNWLLFKGSEKKQKG